MVCIFFTISSGKLDIFMVLHATRIWNKLETIALFQAQAIDPPSPSHELHGKLNAPFFTRNTVDKFLTE